MLPSRALGLPIQWKLMRSDRQDFIGALAAARGSDNKQQVPFLACLLGGQAVSLYEGRVQGLGHRGDLGSLPTPLVALCAEGMHSTLLLLCSSKVAVGFLGGGGCIFFPIICPYYSM